MKGKGYGVESLTKMTLTMAAMTRMAMAMPSQTAHPIARQANALAR